MFTSTFEYSIRAAISLASLGGEACSADRIAQTTGVPPGYISKVLRDLVVAGIAESQRGPHGGFRLSRPAESITMLDILNAVSPLARIKKCPLGIQAHVNLCPLHSRLDAAMDTVEKAFAATTLAELAAPPSPNSRNCRALVALRTTRAGDKR